MLTLRVNDALDAAARTGPEGDPQRISTEALSNSCPWIVTVPPGGANCGSAHIYEPGTHAQAIAAIAQTKTDVAKPRRTTPRVLIPTHSVTAIQGNCTPRYLTL